MMNTELIPQRIREARNSLGLKQTYVAEKLGISRPLLSYYENGERPIPLNVLEDLADLYGVPVWMLGSEDNVDLALTVAFRANNVSENSLSQLTRIRKMAFALEHLEQLRNKVGEQ